MRDFLVDGTDEIPEMPGDWAVPFRNRPAPPSTLRTMRGQAMPFRDLATRTARLASEEVRPD